MRKQGTRAESGRPAKKHDFDEKVARFRQDWKDWEQQCAQTETVAATFPEERSFEAVRQIKDCLVETVQKNCGQCREAGPYDLRQHEECLFATLRAVGVTYCLDAATFHKWTWQRTLQEIVFMLHRMGDERYSRTYALLDSLSRQPEKEQARLIGIASASWKLFPKDKQALRIVENEGRPLHPGEADTLKNRRLLASLALLYDKTPSVAIGDQVYSVGFPLLRTDPDATEAWRRLGPNTGNELRHDFTVAAKAIEEETSVSNLFGADALALDQAPSENEPERTVFAREAFTEAEALLKEDVKMSEREIECWGWNAMDYKDAEIAALLGIGVRTVGTYLRRAREKLRTFQDQISNADSPTKQQTK